MSSWNDETFAPIPVSGRGSRVTFLISPLATLGRTESTAAHSGQRFSWPLQKVTSRGSSIASEKNNKELSRNKGHIKRSAERGVEGFGKHHFHDTPRQIGPVDSSRDGRRNDVFVSGLERMLTTTCMQMPEGVRRRGEFCCDVRVCVRIEW